MTVVTLSSAARLGRGQTSTFQNQWGTNGFTTLRVYVVFLGPVLSKEGAFAYVLSQAFAHLRLGSMLISVALSQFWLGVRRHSKWRWSSFETTDQITAHEWAEVISFGPHTLIFLFRFIKEVYKNYSDIFCYDAYCFCGGVNCLEDKQTILISKLVWWFLVCAASC